MSSEKTQSLKDCFAFGKGSSEIKGEWDKALDTIKTANLEMIKKEKEFEEKNIEDVKKAQTDRQNQISDLEKKRIAALEKKTQQELLTVKLTKESKEDTPREETIDTITKRIKEEQSNEKLNEFKAELKKIDSELATLKSSLPLEEAEIEKKLKAAETKIAECNTKEKTLNEKINELSKDDFFKPAVEEIHRLNLILTANYKAYEQAVADQGQSYIDSKKHWAQTYDTEQFHSHLPDVKKQTKKDEKTGMVIESEEINDPIYAE